MLGRGRRAAKKPKSPALMIHEGGRKKSFPAISENCTPVPMCKIRVGPDIRKCRIIRPDIRQKSRISDKACRISGKKNQIRPNPIHNVISCCNRNKVVCFLHVTASFMRPVVSNCCEAWRVEICSYIYTRWSKKKSERREY